MIRTRSCSRWSALVVGLLAATVWAGEAEEALWKAAKRGDAAAVRQLLANGADVNARTQYGATALAFACDRGHGEVVEVLLEAGAEVNVKDNFYHSTPLDWAAAGGHGHIVRLLLAHGAKGAQRVLRTGAAHGSIAVVRAVLEVGKVAPDIIAACRDLAADRGHDEVAKLLEAALPKDYQPPASVPEEILRTYVGFYQSQQGWEYTIQLKQGHLMIGSPYSAAVRLQPVDERTFRVFDTIYRFRLQDGRVVGFVRRTGSGEMEFEKVVEQQPRPAAGGQAAAPVGSAESRRADLAVSSPNWPQFRGTGARGIADGLHVPLRWNVEQSENVLWKNQIPGLGHSSPVIWGDRVFVTTAISDQPDVEIRPGLYGDVTPVEDKAPHTWRVYCFDLHSGRVIWARTACRGVPRYKRHPKSTHANPTPATDGRHVVAFFGPEGLYCYDIDGKLLWKTMLGPLASGWFYDEEYQWGFGSSPVLFNGSVIVQCDVQQGSFVAAFDLETGRQLWKTPRDEIPTWSTPTVYQGPGGPLLVTNGSRYARGYDPRTGEELWRLGGHSEISVPTPFVARGLIFVCSGYRPIKPIYAVRLNARGNITLKDDQTSNRYIAWSSRHGGPYLPTPLVYREHLYVLSNAGILSCYEATTGKRIYQRRVRSGGAKSFAASLIAADDRIYLTSEEGVVLVVQAGAEMRLLAVNPLGQYCLATPAVAPGIILFRTEHQLIAIGEAVSADRQ